MPDLIDREAALQELQYCFIRKPDPDNIISVTLALARKKISKIPAAEVEPVRHGRWIHDINNLYGCSECLERETMSPKRLKPYCHNCGTKMDLEE